ncbi:MAG: DUF1501 domain-containing protein [Oligoflexus sp.]|nr:DUF1501 domain-containing protein [Oligoflexus sp.]
MSKINRRDILKYSSMLAVAGVPFGDVVWADEDRPIPKTNRFMIYIHFGSQCGIANGLIQPQKAGEWPLGFFQPGAAAAAVNPLLNKHTVSGNMIFHDYMKFLAPMTDHMSLVNLNPQSLDHGVASLFQMCGNSIAAAGVEWPMAVAQNMKGFKNLNPMVITSGLKTLPVTDITPVQAGSVADFASITSDASSIPKGKLDPIWKATVEQYKNSKLGTVDLEASLGNTVDYELNTLTKGLPELAASQADITTLNTMLGAAKVNMLIADCAERTAIAGNADQGTRNKFILAGILAKTGIASGMRMDLIGDDAHFGGADISSARNAAGKWALISLFWDWVKSVGLQDDIMIVVGQEFARSPYNSNTIEQTYIDASGATQTIKTPGRDHGLSAGMMFINAGVPKSGRIGSVSSNLVSVPTKDAKGSPDNSGIAYVSHNIMGSMLMRIYPELFPTERMVRKHWPSFIEIGMITS